MFGMSQPTSRYDREACEHCHGVPPAGFACVYCLSYGVLEGEQPYSPLEGFYEEIDLGDTNELDPGWDRFVECMDHLHLARTGMPPILISRLFRVAVDGYKQYLADRAGSQNFLGELDEPKFEKLA
jgi:hypothetical protein